MRLSEIFIDYIRETKLFEMAYSRQQAWQKVSGISYPLTYHLVKVLLMPESQNREHWLNEIQGYIRSIDNILLKPRNRRLRKQDYWNWLVAEPEYRIDRLVQDAKRQYKQDKITIPVDLEQNVHNILLRLSTDLANNQFTEIEDYI